MPRVFDITMFHWEFDVLELRMRELWDVVDHFVVTESRCDHRGRPRDLVLSNTDRFAWASDKLVVHVSDPPEHAQITWDYEVHHRTESIKAAEKLDPDPDDLFLVSDVDEICRPSAVEFLKGHRGKFVMQMPMFYYYVNLYVGQWTHPTALSYDHLQDPTRVRAYGETFIPNAGWHFSYLGTPEQIKHKLHTFAHDEFDLSHITSLEHIQWAIEQRKDLLERVDGPVPEAVPIDGTWPRYLRQNIDRYSQFILPV